MKRADNFGQSRTRPRDEAGAGGKLEGEKSVRSAAGRSDFLRSDRGGVGAGGGRERGGAEFALKGAGDGADVLLEKADVGVLAPKLAHRKHEGVHRDEQHRDEREGQENFEESEGAAGFRFSGFGFQGRAGIARAPRSRGHLGSLVKSDHFLVFPWISAMRSCTAWRSWVFSTGSDQVGRRTVKIWVVF